MLALTSWVSDTFWLSPIGYGIRSSSPRCVAAEVVCEESTLPTLGDRENLSALPALGHHGEKIAQRHAGERSEVVGNPVRQQ